GPDGQQRRDFGRLVTRIDTAGLWRLAFTGMHAVSIARYPAGHPVVDPGIAPEAIRLDPGSFPAPRFTVEPFDPHYRDVPPPSGTPARMTIMLGDGFTLHLYRRAALAQTELWPHDPSGLVARLLDGDRPLEAGLHLPYYPIGNDFMAYTARPERLRGACFTWLRYIAHFTQEEVFPFDTLTYTALGLSPDGQWVAVATAHAKHAAVEGQPVHSRGRRRQRVREPGGTCRDFTAGPVGAQRLRQRQRWRRQHDDQVKTPVAPGIVGPGLPGRERGAEGVTAGKQRDEAPAAVRQRRVAHRQAAASAAWRSKPGGRPPPVPSMALRRARGAGIGSAARRSGLSAGAGRSDEGPPTAPLRIGRRCAFRRGGGTRACGCRSRSCRRSRRTAAPGSPGRWRAWPA
ncbi:MAG: hypothetical protein J0L57_21885, partial [Burkholderiales bacterium]|nr:hypothetical protein [Burkholderiales bacterium]